MKDGWFIQSNQENCEAYLAIILQSFLLVSCDTLLRNAELPAEDVLFVVCHNSPLLYLPSGYQWSFYSVSVASMRQMELVYFEAVV